MYRYTIFTTLFLTSLSCFSADKLPGKVIAGWVEHVSVEGKTTKVKAKLDSGAMTSSVHATDIEQFKKNGKRWVRFTLSYKSEDGENKTTTLEKPKERGVKIKDHDEDYERRSVVKLKVCFDGRIHETEFTLADRSNFIYPVLLGRRFLRGIAVIDPDETFLAQSTCPKVK